MQCQSRDHGPAALPSLDDLPDLDVLLWTHAHGDHIGGLIDVVAQKPVGRILYSVFDYNSATFNELWS